MLSKTTIVTLLAITSVVALLAVAGVKSVQRIRKQIVTTTEDPIKPLSGTPEQFLKDLNDVRRSFALRFQVPNMHELTWSEDLAKLVKSGNKTSLRYAILYHYQHCYININKVFNRFYSMSEEKRSERIQSMEEGGKEKWDMLEFLAPTQKKVGCAVTQYGFIKCYIGPNKDFGLFDISHNVKTAVAPGSQCLDGYKDLHGLCSPVIPPTRSSRDKDEDYEEDSGVKSFNIFLVSSINLAVFGFLV